MPAYEERPPRGRLVLKPGSLALAAHRHVWYDRRMMRFSHDEWYPDPADIRAHPRPMSDRSTKRHDRLVKAYRRSLRRMARRETDALRKRARGDFIEQVIWGREMQDAYLDTGWVPVSEAPRNEGYTEMTMRLDTRR